MIVHNFCWERSILKLKYAFSSCLVVLQYGVLRSVIAFRPKLSILQLVYVVFDVLFLLPPPQAIVLALEECPPVTVELCLTYLPSELSSWRDLLSLLLQHLLKTPHCPSLQALYKGTAARYSILFFFHTL